MGRGSKPKGVKDKIHHKKFGRQEQKLLDDVKASIHNAGTVMNDAERELYRYDLPKQERGFTDLLKSHKPGERFPYVAITGNDPESYDARVRRLVQLQPRINSRTIDLPEYVVVDLCKEIELYPLSQVLMYAGRKSTINYRFLMLRKATVIFAPMTSMTDVFTNVKVTIVDSRFRTPVERGTLLLGSNNQYRGELNMDHCIPKTSADKVHLSISAEAPILNTGEQWGACQVFMEVEESDFPQVAPFKEVAGVSALPPTALETFDYDPTYKDLVIRNNHRKQLQDMYLAGDIADETEPMQEKKTSKVQAKSSAQRILRSAMKSSDDDEWAVIRKGVKATVADDANSLDVRSEPSTRLSMAASQAEKGDKVEELLSEVAQESTTTVERKLSFESEEAVSGLGAKVQKKVGFSSKFV